MILCMVHPDDLHLVQNLPDLILAEYNLLFKKHVMVNIRGWINF